MPDIVVSTPVLQKTARDGLPSYWQGHLVQDGAQWGTQRTWWSQVTDGGESVRQWSVPVWAEPKNVGRSNETTPEQQARSELASLEARQRDKGYAESGDASTGPVLPMLAQSYAKAIHRVDWSEAYASPKLDGTRMLLCGNKAWSRQGKPYIPAVVSHLLFDTGGVVLDGELIGPSDWTFQDTLRAIKKSCPESSQLQYHIYDCVDQGSDFTRRYAVVRATLRRAPTAVHLVPAYPVHNEDELFAHHQQFVAQGYEGTMLRHGHGGYAVGQRDVQLLKIKDFLDQEYPIVGVQDGKGKEQGLAIFTCVTPAGREFAVRPQGTEEERREMFQRAAEYLGKPLTVRYQNLSEDGIPRFPVGIAVRENFDR